MGRHRNSISSLAFNTGDSHLAAGDLNGDIFLHSMANPKSTSVLKPSSYNSNHTSSSSPQAIKSIQFSPFKRSILASCGDDGIVHVWDWINLQLITPPLGSCHRAPATGIAFSPFNHLLLASCGLDKRALFFDVSEKKAVKTIKTEHPLTSMAFMDDGITVALGSSKGYIYIYDLRHSSLPVRELAGHAPYPVLALSFQTSQDKESAQSGASIVTSGANRQHLTPVTPGSEMASMPGAKESSVIKNSNLKDSVVSPVMVKPPVTPLHSSSTVTGKTSSPLGIDGVFSPLKSTTPTLPSSPLVTKGEAGSSDGDGSRRELEPPSLLSTPRLSSEQWNGPVDSSHSDKHILKDVGNMTPFTSLLASHSPPRENQHLAMSKEKENGSSVRKLKEKAFLLPTSSPVPVDDVKNKTDRTVTKATKPQDAAAKPGEEPPSADNAMPAVSSLTIQDSAFQTEFVKGVIDDCLDEFRSSVHRDVQNMHLEMIRQFEIQKVMILLVV